MKLMALDATRTKFQKVKLKGEGVCEILVNIKSAMDWLAKTLCESDTVIQGNLL